MKKNRFSVVLLAFGLLLFGCGTTNETSANTSVSDSGSPDAKARVDSFQQVKVKTTPIEKRVLTNPVRPVRKEVINDEPISF